jgi:uncharacterized protein (UPF0335 family)
MTEVVAADQLRSIVERIERLEEDKKVVQQDIKEVYSEAEGNGFDKRILKMVVRIRKMEDADRAEQEAVLDLYTRALGM